MTQEPKLGPPPIGVIYNTSMSRPDAALALAALHVAASRRELRMGALCVTGAGLEAALFCDIVGRFYAGQGRAPSSNAVLPIGLAAAAPLPPDPPMVDAANRRRNANGEPQYARTIQKMTDTALAEAVLRNGVTFNAESALVLSAPAGAIARSLDLAGTTAQYKQRVKRVVIVDGGNGAGTDPAALRKFVSECPAPIVFAGRDIGEALPFPAAALDKLAAWAPMHPVADAYRAFQTMPYDTPSHDLAAVHYAVHPGAGFFSLSEPGTLTASADGRIAFAAGSGPVRRLILDPGKQAECLAALVALATAKPTAPQGRGSGA